MRLFVATSEFFTESRNYKLKYIYQTLKELSSIKTEFTKAVLTINPVSSEKFIEILETLSDIPMSIEVRVFSGDLSNPYMLCWEHKKYLAEVVDQGYTHFLYYENDQLVTQSSIDYWVNSRDMFLRNGLNFIPAFHRVEQNFHGEIYSMDCLRPVDRSKRPILEFHGQRFISMCQPYQGMYMMDRDLVKEHFTSAYFSYNPQHEWGIPEQANMGNMLDNIPSGFEHRLLVPLDNFSDCWIHHIQNKYVNDPEDLFSKIPTKSLFIG
jgi:hypothetical protein